MRGVVFPGERAGAGWPGRTQFAKPMGARAIALDTNPQRLERAREFGRPYHPTG
jgi:D-arabinose 1-dehydrogenase-like Zn-dependent alcohol dehydrogenase